jgi:hypothetical protein
MLVIGSSDTGGRSLSDPSQAWPNLVAAELGTALGQPVEPVDVPIIWMGPKAVPRALKALDEDQPEVVVFAYGAFHFIIATVEQRVLHRYGKRAHRLYKRLERRFEKSTRSDGAPPKRVNHLGRRIARRIIGVDTPSTREEVTALQSEVLRELSQREGVVVVMLAAPDVPGWMVQDNPRANLLLGAHREHMTQIGVGHHFLIADCVEEFRAAADRDRLSTADGIHKSAEGHLIQARSVMKVLLEPPSPLAPAEDAPARAASEPSTIG